MNLQVVTHKTIITHDKESQKCTKLNQDMCSYMAEVTTVFTKRKKHKRQLNQAS